MSKSLLLVLCQKPSSVIYIFKLFSLSAVATVNRLEENCPPYSRFDEKLLSAAQCRKIRLGFHCIVQGTKNKSGFVEDEIFFSQMAFMVEMRGGRKEEENWLIIFHTGQGWNSAHCHERGVVWALNSV